MSLKGFGLLVPLIGAVYLSGVFGSSYSREVGRPPAEVMAALADLDITAQPGSPGTDPTRSGGVKPVFLLERQSDRMIWTVMSGDQVAIRMTAVIKPAKDGRHSQVTAFVERGDAPDDFVSPAFRNTGIAMGLFGLALEDELNALTLPALADPSVCEKLIERFEMENIASGFAAAEPESLTQGVGHVAKMVIALHAQEAELRRNGCDTRRGHDWDGTPRGEGDFTRITNEMGGDPTSFPTATRGDPPPFPTETGGDPTRIDPSVTEIPAGIR